MPTEATLVQPATRGHHTGAVALVNGHLLPTDAPALRVDDRGFLFGEGLFETMRCVDGDVRAFSRHVRRLRIGLARLRVPDPGVDRLAPALRGLLTANGLDAGEATLRLTVSRGPGAAPRAPEGPPTVVAQARPMGARTTARRQGMPLRRVDAPGRFLPVLKTLGYLPNLMALAQVGADEEPLFCVGDRLLEGATCNVFIARGDTLLTPPADGALLPGIGRALLLEAAADAGLDAREQTITVGDLRAASWAVVTNALLPIAPVRSLDGQALPPPPTATLAALRTAIEVRSR